MKVSGFDDTIAWYNQNAQKYATVNSGLADLDQIDELAKRIPAGSRILDAGCAAGRDSNLFAKRGFKVTGIDISDGLIEIAKRDFPRIKFIKMSFLNLSFNDECFDAVWAHQSLLHLESINHVTISLKEFYRVLKPKGILLVLVKAQMGNDKTAIVSDTFSGHDRFFQYFTKDEINNLLDNVGFEIIKLEQYMEIDKNPQGRPEVGLILSISRKP